MKRAVAVVIFGMLTCGASVNALAFDIAKDLFVKGDLHESWEATPLADPPPMFKDVPATTKKGDHRLMRAGKRKGGVTAFQYDNAADAATAYDVMLKGMGSDTEVVEGLGDQSRAFGSVTKLAPKTNISDFELAGVLFLRGKTVVYIGLADMKAEELFPFAKKIDARIQK